MTGAGTRLLILLSSLLCGSLLITGCRSTEIGQRGELAQTWRHLAKPDSGLRDLLRSSRHLRRSHSGMAATFRSLKGNAARSRSAFDTLFHGFLGPYHFREVSNTWKLLSR